MAARWPLAASPLFLWLSNFMTLRILCLKSLMIDMDCLNLRHKPPAHSVTGNSERPALGHMNWEWVWGVYKGEVDHQKRPRGDKSKEKKKRKETSTMINNQGIFLIVSLKKFWVTLTLKIRNRKHHAYALKLRENSVHLMQGLDLKF